MINTKEIVEKMIKDIEGQANQNSYGEFESDYYEVMPDKFIKLAEEEKCYNVIFCDNSSEKENPYETGKTYNKDIEEVIAVLDYFIKNEKSKTGKMIVITSDDEIQIVDYTGLESMQKNVEGYIEHFYSNQLLENVYVDAYCNEDFLFINTDECKKTNAIASYLSKKVIMGNTVFLKCEDDDTTGFDEKETEQLVKLFNNIKQNRLSTLNLYHKMYDKK